MSNKEISLRVKELIGSVERDTENFVLISPRLEGWINKSSPQEIEYSDTEAQFPKALKTKQVTRVSISWFSDCRDSGVMYEPVLEVVSFIDQKEAEIQQILGVEAISKDYPEPVKILALDNDGQCSFRDLFRDKARGVLEKIWANPGVRLELLDDYINKLNIKFNDTLCFESEIEKESGSQQLMQDRLDWYFRSLLNIDPFLFRQQEVELPKWFE